MAAGTRLRPELLLLLSLLLVILLYPALDHGDLRKVILTALMFVPVILSTIRLSQKRSWVWPSVLLMGAALIFSVISILLPNPTVLSLKWASLAAFFAFTVVGLFTYLKNATSITQSHLHTAISIYLLLGLVWFALYCAIDAIAPGSFSSTYADRQSELLYFSLVTLTTIGYGDVVARQGEARMLAALEGMAGVLYVAITMAILVNAFRRKNSSSSE